MSGEIVRSFDPALYPKVPPWRRGAALGIDFMGAALLSVALGLHPIAIAVLFLLIWFGLRVVVVLKNKGQSLGRWAFDMKILDARDGKIPLFIDLAKREGIVGLGCLLAWFGLLNLNPASAWALLLFIPLGIDCGFAFADPLYRQALHDRAAQTIVVQSRRGYSLDLKLKRLVADVRRRVKQ